MGQLSAILAPTSSFPSQLNGPRRHVHTLRNKAFHQPSDITAVSSAVSACAINSVAERADCLCRKYLTPDPSLERRKILILAWKWWTGSLPVHQSWHMGVGSCSPHGICPSPCMVFCNSVMYYLMLSGGFMIRNWIGQIQQIIISIKYTVDISDTRLTNRCDICIVIR